MLRLFILLFTNHIKMRSIILCLSLCSFIALVPAYAQSLAEKIKAENVVPGAIIKKGKRTEGYIKAVPLTEATDDFFGPWQFQDDIRFIEADDFAKLKKVKNKHYEKYGPKDIDGYEYEDMLFESGKYADMSAVGANMIPRWRFLHKLSDGEIVTYHYYQKPPPVTVTNDVAATMSPFYVPQLLYKKGKKGKIRQVSDMNVKKELEDCPDVLARYENGDFGLVDKDGEKGLLQKMADKTVLREEIRLRVIEAYNEGCQ